MRRFIAKVTPALCAVTALFAALPPAASQAPSGTPRSGASAQRILSIGGDVTEILYALGAEGRIVAVDTTSQFPPRALRDKKNVGYMRALSTEGVLSVGADLIVASDRAGPAEIVKALRVATPYVEIAEGLTAKSVPEKIMTVAKAVGSEDEGRRLAASVSAELEALERDRQTITKPLRALFILTVTSGRATVGGAGTTADAIFKLAGLENAAANTLGFKPVGDEGLMTMNPDLIVTMQPVPGNGHDTSDVLSLVGLAQSPAVRYRRVIAMDGLLLLGFGPRVAAAARELMQAAYKEALGHPAATR